jgi:hypothetical protein
VEITLQTLPEIIGAEKKMLRLNSPGSISFALYQPLFDNSPSLITLAGTYFDSVRIAQKKWPYCSPLHVSYWALQQIR